MHTLEELMKDDEFMKNIAAVTTAEDICDLFHQKGVEVTKEDAEEALRKVMETDGELNVADLEEVTGGSPLVVGVVGVAITVGALYGLLKLSKRR